MRHPILIRLTTALVAVTIVNAESISFGVKAGVPLTDAFSVARGDQSVYQTATKRYIVGPTIEFHLPARFSIEVDALYTRVGFDNRTTPFYSVTRANSWQFPLLGKFEILPGPVRPFVDLGANFRHISGVRQLRQVVSVTTLNQVEIRDPAEFNKETDIGASVGFGLAFKAGPVRIAPEFRYTRWGGENFRDPVRSLLNTNRNDGMFLLGLTF